MLSQTQEQKEFPVACQREGQTVVTEVLFLVNKAMCHFTLFYCRLPTVLKPHSNLNEDHEPKIHLEKNNIDRL